MWRRNICVLSLGLFHFFAASSSVFPTLFIRFPYGGMDICYGVLAYLTLVHQPEGTVASSHSSSLRWFPRNQVVKRKSLSSLRLSFGRCHRINADIYCLKKCMKRTLVGDYLPQKIAKLVIKILHWPSLMFIPIYDCCYLLGPMEMIMAVRWKDSWLSVALKRSYTKTAFMNSDVKVLTWRIKILRILRVAVVLCWTTSDAPMVTSYLSAVARGDSDCGI